MLLFSSAKPKLTFTPLSNCMEHLPIAAKWAEDKWGYIRHKGIQYREGLMRELSNDIYIGTLSGVPVAMFALLDIKEPNTRELMYVYVDKDWRGFGFGHQIIETAKKLTAKAHMNTIKLDTLNPNLNRLYEKHGATVICEGRLFKHPMEVLTIAVQSNERTIGHDATLLT